MSVMPFRLIQKKPSKVMKTSKSWKQDFFIDPSKPYLGASPDSIVNCKCCGKGVLEVKCPYCIKDGLPEESENSFCMTKEKWLMGLAKKSCILLPGTATNGNLPSQIW